MNREYLRKCASIAGISYASLISGLEARELILPPTELVEAHRPELVKPDGSPLFDASGIIKSMIPGMMGAVMHQGVDGLPAAAGWTGTLNPSDKSANVTLSGGNLIGTWTGAGAVRGTVSKTAGPAAFEFAITAAGTSLRVIGIEKSTVALSTYPGADADGYGYYCDGSSAGIANAGSFITPAPLYGLGDNIGVVMDAIGTVLRFYKNGSLVASVAITSGTWFPAIAMFSATWAGTSKFIAPLTYPIG